MKTILSLFSVVVITTILLPALLHAQDRPYTEGSVWSVTMIRTKPGMTDDYLRSLKNNLKKTLDEAKKENLVLSYKILSGTSANNDDWDILLMEEYKNMASLDGIDDKMDALAKKLVGNEDQQKKVMTSRVEMREIFGSKLLRELTLK